MNQKRKNKKCRECGEPFLPYKSTQIVCSTKCAIENSRKKRIKEDLKDWKNRKRQLKKKLLTPSQKKQRLQKTFNYYIRLRDKGKNCISCDKPLGEKYHAGHFYSVGGWPELRFNELNCNGQCEKCNVFLHGNGNLYRLGLIKRIGKENVEKLDQLAGKPIKYTSQEIENLNKKYKKLIKKME